VKRGLAANIQLSEVTRQAGSYFLLRFPRQIFLELETRCTFYIYTVRIQVGLEPIPMITCVVFYDTVFLIPDVLIVARSEYEASFQL
jgi:hypothetical protein